jgi:hypothetical protein
LRGRGDVVREKMCGRGLKDGEGTQRVAEGEIGVGRSYLRLWRQVIVMEWSYVLT